MALLGVLSTALLFSEFHANALRVALPKWFATSQRDTQAHVIGRIVKSRQDGLFSAGGLSGWGSPNESIPFSPVDQWPDGQSVDFQYRAFREGLTFKSYKPYLSQSGGQAFGFGLLDLWLPLAAEAKLEWFQGLTSLLTAAVLAGIVVWFFLELGWCVALSALVSLIFAQYVVVLGRNLWWSIWAFYLPMLGVLYFLRYDRTTGKRHHIRCGLLVFVLLAVKCWINGFEFITTTLIMTLVPFVYYGIRDGPGARATLKRLLLASSSASLAVLFSVVVVCLQVAAVEGSFGDGVQHLLYSFEKRSFGDPQGLPPEYHAGLESGTLVVVRAYLEYASYVDFGGIPWIAKNVIPRVKYHVLLLLFLVASVVVCVRRRGFIRANRWRSSLALVAATWFSVLAPLSWFVIFKAHSFVHTHINYVVWQMPFTIFGFAVCGLAVTIARGDERYRPAGKHPAASRTPAGTRRRRR